MANSESGSRISNTKRFIEMTPQEQINFACSGDPGDDDGTQLLLDDEDDEEN